MRIAITGRGCVSPLGDSAPATIEAIGRDGLGIVPAAWSTGAAGSALFAPVVESFDPSTLIPPAVLAGTDRFVHYGLSACSEALAQAGLGPEAPVALDPLRTAVVDGTSMGGFYSLMEAQASFETAGAGAIDPKAMLKIWSNMTSAQVSMWLGLHGPSLTVTTACASALDAIGQAAALIAVGAVDVALCGGTEGGAPRRTDAPGFTPVTSVAGRLLGMESPAEDPRRAVLPFDVERSGIVFGEGAAWFVLESEAHATGRGATPVAWLRGYGSCADGYHPSSPDPTGEWESHAMGLAQRSAGLGASDVDVVVAHATGTPKGDLAEARALNRTFVDSGERPDVVVTSLKGHTGHTGASSGAMSVVAAIAVLDDGRVSPVLGTTAVDPEVHFDLVLGGARSVSARVVQVNAFGFGGQDASVLLSDGR